MMHLLVTKEKLITYKGTLARTVRMKVNRVLNVILVVH